MLKFIIFFITCILGTGFLINGFKEYLHTENKTKVIIVTSILVVFINLFGASLAVILDLYAKETLKAGFASLDIFAKMLDIII